MFIKDSSDTDGTEPNSCGSHVLSQRVLLMEELFFLNDGSDSNYLSPDKEKSTVP